jgi:hypothetical protein
MKMNLSSAARLAVLLGLLGTSAVLAFEAGHAAYTKRVETNLLTEPRPLAPLAGKLGYRRKVTINEVRGGWLRVSDGPAGGWVFAGNLAEKQPEEIKGADGLPLSASQTTATAAARPLTPAANDYAVRRNLGEARRDLDWLQAQCKALTPEEVNAYLQAQKKGEFQ